MTTIDNTAVTPEGPRKRGRPRTGTALSAADRQARRRAKLEAEGKTILPPVVVSQQVAEALASYIRFKDMTLGDAVEKILHHRLLRKRSGKRKPRAATTNNTNTVGASAPAENH